MFSKYLPLLALFVASAQAGKRGLVWPWYNGGLNPGILNNGQGQVVAIYDYETYAPPSTNGNGGLGFIGMQRCLDCSSSPIGQLAARQKAQGWTTVFSLNEPDLAGISPSQAASWYKQWINPLAIKKALPSVTSDGSAGKGLDWVAQMISACGGGCYFDYINLVSVRFFGEWVMLTSTLFSIGTARTLPRSSRISPTHTTSSRYEKCICCSLHLLMRHPQNYKIVITEFALQNPSGGSSAQ
jgi:hypothetical protein